MCDLHVVFFDFGEVVLCPFGYPFGGGDGEEVVAFFFELLDVLVGTHEVVIDDFNFVGACVLAAFA